MTSEDFISRRARTHDAEGIHIAHMKSIQEICSKDHSPEEIQAWGHRPYQEDHRINAIQNHLVWVVEHQSTIQGFGHLRIFEKDGMKKGYIHGLYLTPQATGKWLAKAIFELMLVELKIANASQVTLESTLTAQEFYRKLGFQNTSPETTVDMRGTAVRCYPMKMEIR